MALPGRAFARLRVAGGVSRRKPIEGDERGTRPLGERSLLHIYRVGKTAMKHGGALEDGRPQSVR